MLKRKKKLMALSLAILLSFSTIAPVTYTALANDTENGEEQVVETQESDEDNCYISGLQIKSVVDGSAPFDEDDTAGNDSSDNNGIVRSFDEINYSIEYVTAIRDTTQGGINEGYVEVRFTLPCSVQTAVFNESTMNWCLNRKITYFYDDGTSGEKLDKSKTVVKQVLTGERYLVNSDAGNTIPGTGTLSVGLKVQAAQNGAMIQPEFSLWMKGNTENDVETVTPDPIKVSAAPKYNLVMTPDEGLDYLGYFNETTGRISSEKENNTVYGRLTRYALVMQLYNDNTSKGLKGIEMPQGNVSFDLSVNAELDGVVTSGDDFKAVLWDYVENNSGATGHMGRPMAPNTASGYAYYGPGNKDAGRSEAYCYDGGKFTVTQDATDSSLYHCTISDYQIDYEKMHFPKRYLWSNDGNVTYGANIGCVSSMNIEFLSTFPETTDTQKTLYQDVQIINTKVTSASGQTGQEMVTNDNHCRRNITLWPVGSISKYMRYCDDNGNYLATTYYGGDNVAYPGQNIKLESFIHGRAEYSFSDFNLLQKFDDEALEVNDGTFTYWKAYASDKAKIKLLFAAKPDKTGWASDAEMNSAKEETLVYFDSIEELKKAGYTCVALLYEVRGADTSSVTSYITYYDLYTRMKVKADASIVGNVYQTVSELRAWRKNTKEMAFSWTDYPYKGNTKIFGSGGEQSTGYVTGYTEPYTFASSGSGYQKVSYVNGAMYGHNGYNMGNSLLIIGNNVGVTVTGADKTDTGTKTVYDMDAGERTATYNISPSIKINSANAGVMGSDMTDNLTVTAKLPKGLHYNTSSKDPESVTENADGTSTIVWKYEKVNAKDTIPTLSLSVTIGEEGTINDVSNNEKLVVGVSIQSDNDKRSATLANGKYAESSITIIKLAASAVTERVMEPLVEQGDDIVFRMRYSNLSDVSADNVKMYNILPENGDVLGSDFSGGYQITSIRMDFANAPKTFQNYANSTELYYTKNADGKQKSVMENTLKNGAIDSMFLPLRGTKGQNEFVWAGLTLRDVSAFVFGLDHVFGNEYLDIYITIRPVPVNGKYQQAGDIYKNNFTQYADNQAEIVVSNTAAAQVVQRTINGTTWIDENKNGIRETSEQKLAGVTVSLYSTKIVKPGDAAAYVINNTNLYPAYDMYGNLITSKKTGLAGEYEYRNLRSGSYYLVFTGTEGYGMTTANVGDNDSIDSDTAAILKNNILTYQDVKTALSAAYIENIELPEIKNMTESTYTSADQDSGFTKLPNPGQAVAKIADRTSGTTFNDVTKRYDGKKTAGMYQNKETATFTITASNTGDCDLQSPVIKEDVSNYKDYMENITFSMKKGDKIKTKNGAEVTVTDIKKTDLEYQIFVDRIPAKDEINFAMSGNVDHVTERLENLVNTVTLSSNFTWNADGQDQIFTCKTPDTIVNGVNYSSDIDKFSLSGLGSITIKKTDGKNPLQNVSYRLTGDDGTIYEKTTDANGLLEFSKLPAQGYTLTEIRTVDGKQLMADNVKISLPLKLSAQQVKDEHVDTSKGYYSQTDGNWYFYDLTYEIRDDTILQLPKTGLPIYLEILMGCMIPTILLAGIWIWSRQKNK